MMLFAQESARSMFQLNTQPLLDESGIPLAVMGILVVFLSLILLSLFITVLPKALAVLARYHPEAPDLDHASMATDGKLPDELLVVIAAAVNEVIDQPYRIIRTRQLTAEDLGWAYAGRRRHHTSHKTIPRDR